MPQSDLPPNVQGQLADMWRRVYQQARALADQEMAKVLGNIVRGGKILPAALPIATTSSLGAVEPDGTTVTITSGGVISASGASGTGGMTVLLDYAASTDLASPFSITAQTWTDLIANQSFTKASGSTKIYVAVRGMCQMSSGSNGGSRIVVDSAGTPVNKMIGGTAAAGANFLAGTNVVPVSGLAAGSHTVKVQVYTNVAGSGYFRPATFPNLEHLEILVWES